MLIISFCFMFSFSSLRYIVCALISFISTSIIISRPSISSSLLGILSANSCSKFLICIILEIQLSLISLICIYTFIINCSIPNLASSIFCVVFVCHYKIVFSSRSMFNTISCFVVKLSVKGISNFFI